MAGRDHEVLIVEGSKGDEYEITFYFLDGEPRLSCSCQAGDFGQLCKHRRAILSGDISDVIDGDVGAIPDIVSALQTVGVIAMLADLEVREAEAEALKRSIAAAKKKIGQLLG